MLGHGFGGSARNFRPQARALAPAHRVVLFDARGHARSEAPPDAAAYAPECFVEDLRRIIDDETSGAAIVGGLSMGAGIALRFALRYPQRVRGLVLAAFPSGSESSSSSWAESFAAALDANGVDAAGNEFVWGERSKFDPSGAKLIRQGFLEHRAHALAHVLRELLAVQPSITELKPELEGLVVPTLVVVGSDDRVSLEPSRELARVLPAATLAVVEGAGHVVNLAAPKKFNALLQSFVDALPPI